MLVEGNRVGPSVVEEDPTSDPHVVRGRPTPTEPGPPFTEGPLPAGGRDRSRGRRVETSLTARFSHHQDAPSRPTGTLCRTPRGAVPFRPVSGCGLGPSGSAGGRTRRGPRVFDRERGESEVRGNSTGRPDHAKCVRTSFADPIHNHPRAGVGPPTGRGRPGTRPTTGVVCPTQGTWGS